MIRLKLCFIVGCFFLVNHFSIPIVRAAGATLTLGHRPNSLPHTPLGSERFTNTLDFLLAPPRLLDLRIRVVFTKETLIYDSVSFHIKGASIQTGGWLFAIPFGAMRYKPADIYALRTNQERYYYGLAFGKMAGKIMWQLKGVRVVPVRRSKITVDSGEFELKSDSYYHNTVQIRTRKHQLQFGQYNQLRGGFQTIGYHTSHSLKHIPYANYTFSQGIASRTFIRFSLNHAFVEQDPIVLHYITGERALDYATDEFSMAVHQRF